MQEKVSLPKVAWCPIHDKEGRKCHKSWCRRIQSRLVVYICNNLHLGTRTSRMGMIRLISDTWCLILNHGSTNTQMSQCCHSNRRVMGFPTDQIKEVGKLDIVLQFIKAYTN